MANDTQPIRDFEHLPLETEIRSIGGHYEFFEELRLPFEGREILYYVGCGVVDRSCCGVGACGFALVAGTIVEWHCRRTPAGLPVSRVAPLTQTGIQREITRRIMQHATVGQVKFYEWYR